MSPRKKKLTLAVSALAVLGVVTLLSFFGTPAATSQPLSVSFVGYTNAFASALDRRNAEWLSRLNADHGQNQGPRMTAVFVVSNQSSRVVKRWGGAYLESPPFAKDSGPTNSNWAWASGSPIPDRFLKPGQAERLMITETPAGDEWRLRIPWSWGIRARVAVAARGYSFLPGWIRVAPNFYACSDPVRLNAPTNGLSQ
jgi:hypothetical protein